MSDKAKLKRYAAKMPHPRDGTNTDRGIETMTKLFKQKWRENVPKVGIVVTDGISKNRTKTLRQARTLKRMGVKMFSVGVGLANFIDYDELNGVASNKDQVLMVDSFDELAKNIIKLVKLICPGKCISVWQKHLYPQKKQQHKNATKNATRHTCNPYEFFWILSHVPFCHTRSNGLLIAVWDNAWHRYMKIEVPRDVRNSKSGQRHGLKFRTHVSPKIGLDQVSGGLSVFCLYIYHTRCKCSMDTPRNRVGIQIQWQNHKFVLCLINEGCQCIWLITKMPCDIQERGTSYCL